MIPLDYQQVLQHLDSQIELAHSSKKWGLENISSAIEYLHIDLSSLHIIQVVGTNGKGSTCHFIHQIFSQHGFKVGTYTKPHLCSVRERICITEFISQQDFARIYNQLLPTFDKFLLSYFEKLTLLALVYFIEEKVDWAIFETGLGGRLDAVTALQAKSVVFTSISMDHTEYLGNTIEEIVQEKAYTMRNCQQVFSGVQTSLVRELLCKIAEEYRKKIHFSFITYQADITPKGTDFFLRDKIFHIPMFGLHYAQNAILAIEVAQFLLEKSFSFSSAYTALSRAFWKGRLEFVHLAGYNNILLSSAHNEDSLYADLQTIVCMLSKNILPRCLSILFATSRYRPADQFMGMILDTLQTYCLNITVTMIPPYQYPYFLLKESSFATKLNFIEDHQQALSSVLQPDSGKTVLVIGSIYLCGMVLQYLGTSDIYDGETK